MNCHNSLYNKALPPQRPHSSIPTNVERALQITPFMQNEPNFQKLKMTINYCPKRSYNNFYFSGLPENEPKRTQNEPKVKIGKIDTNPLLQKHLYIFPPLRTYKNEPKQTQFDRTIQTPGAPTLALCSPFLLPNLTVAVKISNYGRKHEC